MMRNFTETEKKYIHWLYHIPGIGRKRMGVILSRRICPEELYHLPVVQLRSFFAECCGFSEKESGLLSERIGSYKKTMSPQPLWEKLQAKGVHMLLLDDEMYPKRLADIPDAPVILYMRGDCGAARRFSAHVPVVAVVGARECSEYGAYVASKLGEYCARYEIGLVSGMAAGVDGISQKASARNGGLVAAVLGCGCDVCYPETNRQLYCGLVEKGCVYSEYLPGTEPKANYFPPRNRIISGMADALIVVEAKEKSGTLITVDMALEQGRDVYVVPGRLTDPMSRGCNKLLGQGASVVCNMEETLTEILHNHCAGIPEIREKREDGGAQINPYEKDSLCYEIYRSLDIVPKSVQQIYDVVRQGKKDEMYTVSALQTELMLMHMSGQIGEKDGRFFLLSS